MTGDEHLLETDREFLNRKGWDVEVTIQNGERLIIIHGYKLPAKYSPREADLIVKQPSGYPDAGMDSFWTWPDVVIEETGKKPQNTETSEEIAGKQCQYWSRHGSWRAGTDNLETFLASVSRALDQ